MVLFWLHFIIGTLTFYLGNVLTLRDNIMNLTTLLGGGLLPLAMLPGVVQALAGYTPMPSVYYIPARIFSDASLSGDVTATLMRTQAGWAAALAVIAWVVWKISLRKYSPQGG